VAAKMEQSQVVADELKTKQKHHHQTRILKPVIADQKREPFEDWLLALARAKKITMGGGYDVKGPPPHPGHPRFLLFKTQPS
jgi:hypothetical protein